MGHARALLGTPDRAFQEQLAKRAVAEDLSVREVEEAIRHRGDAGPPTPGSPRATKLRPPGLLELEELLGDYLETRVRITMSPRRGRVEVEFATLEDLERIYRVITDARPPA
jgi:ParB family chromosome partitioning protein